MINKSGGNHFDFAQTLIIDYGIKIQTVNKKKKERKEKKDTVKLLMKKKKVPLIDTLSSLMRGVFVNGGRWQQEISNLTNKVSITTRIFYSKWLITS